MTDELATILGDERKRVGAARAQAIHELRLDRLAERKLVEVSYGGKILRLLGADGDHAGDFTG